MSRELAGFVGAYEPPIANDLSEFLRDYEGKTWESGTFRLDLWHGEVPVGTPSSCGQSRRVVARVANRGYKAFFRARPALRALTMVVGFDRRSACTFRSTLAQCRFGGGQGELTERGMRGRNQTVKRPPRS